MECNGCAYNCHETLSIDRLEGVSVENREFDKMMEQLMKQDFSVGTEKFRDALLGRCLAVLDEDDEGIHLDDSELDMLAAAGDAFSQCGISGSPYGAE